MVLTTFDGEYVRVNQALCDLLGRTAGELLEAAVLHTTYLDDLNETVAAAVCVGASVGTAVARPQALASKDPRG